MNKNVSVSTSSLYESRKSKASLGFIAGNFEERRVRHMKIRDSSELQEFYQYKEQIGKGTFGTVYSIKDKKTDKVMAMKMIEKGKLGSKLAAVEIEIRILKIVNHPHIIWLDRIFESDRKYYLVMELCHGTLNKVLKERGRVSEQESRKILMQLSSAVAYLHRKDIVHRDLKLENILLSCNPDDETDRLYVKVSDFGLSIILTGYSHKTMLSDMCGTIAYMSPEMLVSHSYSQQCDVWAMGVIMYILLYGNFPFAEREEQALMNQICNKVLSFSELPVSKEAIHLISKMLEKNAAFRITAAETQKHPWLTGTHGAQGSPENVLDMMKKWKSEMTLASSDEQADWLATARPGTSNLPQSCTSSMSSTMSTDTQQRVSISPSAREKNDANASSRYVYKGKR